MMSRNFRAVIFCVDRFVGHFVGVLLLHGQETASADGHHGIFDHTVCGGGKYCPIPTTWKTTKLRW